MTEPLFIGAGTRGAKLVGNTFQPYMVFGGKTCLEHVVEAAMQAVSVGDIYIWGDKKILDEILAGHRQKYHHKITLVEERENIAESFFLTFLQYVSSESNILKDRIAGWTSIKAVDWRKLHENFCKTDFWEKQVNVMVSDTPLISAYEIDYLIRNKNRDADIVIGRTVRKDYKNILEIFGHFPDKERSIKNFYTYRVGNRDIPLIVNSYMAGKPFKLNENIWNIINNFYVNRTIIAGRKKNLRKIATNLLLFKRLFFPSNNTVSDGYNYAEKARAAFYLINAYKSIVKSKSASIHYRNLKKIYRSIHTLVGLSIEIQLSHCFGSAFDIDTEYESDFVRDNFSALREICSEYYKTHDSPQV